MKRPRPQFYPQTANSAIYDSQAFSVGDSTLVHTPADFPDGLKIIASCGVYAWAAERDSRVACWRDSEVNCPNCL